MICLIENRTYELDKKMLNGILSLAKEKYEKSHKHAIYAVLKDDICDLKREEADDMGKLLESVKKYEDEGFTVLYV